MTHCFVLKLVNSVSPCNSYEYCIGKFTGLRRLENLLYKGFRVDDNMCSDVADLKLSVLELDKEAMKAELKHNLGVVELKHLAIMTCWQFLCQFWLHFCKMYIESMLVKRYDTLGS